MYNLQSAFIMLTEIRSLENPRVQIFRAIREKKVTTEKKGRNISTSAKIQRGWKEKDSISSVGTERRIQEILEIERNGQHFSNFN